MDMYRFMLVRVEIKDKTEIFKYLRHNSIILSLYANVEVSVVICNY